tara:strand:- start:6506 stop:6778 length:273 start_codon:yes stop_codon:yes gene_type:complete
MARFKPQVSYITKDSLNEYYKSSKPKSMYITKHFSTYSELKKSLPEICECNIDVDGVHVVRSRRGQWGEYNERWKLDISGKPIIINETWS